jgi:hypothetical protein
MEATKDSQFCRLCEGRLTKRMSVPSLRTSTTFMSGQHEDDGFGTDDRSRKLARAKAEAMGVNISGKKYHPGLCRKGVPLDPQAWYGDESEVRKKAAAKGCNVHGSIEMETSVPDYLLKKAAQPYQCSRATVQPDVDREVKEVHGGKATKKQRDNLYRKFQAKHSGSRAVVGTPTLRPH